MTDSLIIALGGLAVVGAVTLWVRRQREMSRRRALADRHGWTVLVGSERDLLTRLGGLALTQVAHSRRVAGAFRADGPAYLLAYVFETGFEHKRRSHHWIVVAREVDHGWSRATITSQDWLRAVATAPAYRQFYLNESRAHRGDDSSPVVIVEDADQWRHALQGNLGGWFATQPRGRTWEIVPGLIVGYEPGRLQDAALAELAAATAELARLLLRG